MRSPLSLVFLHGFMGKGVDWSEIASHFTADHRVLTPDLPGHGGTPISPGLDFNSATEDLANEIIGFAPGRTVLVGYSMGGRLALALTAAHPELVEGLVLVSAAPGLANAVDRRARVLWEHALADEMKNRFGRGFLERWYAQELFCTLNQQPDLLARLVEQRMQIQAVRVADSLPVLGTSAMPWLGDVLRNPPCPTLVLAGAEDRKYAGLAGQLMGVHGRLQVKILPETSHALHLEKPLIFRDLLRDFLHVIEGGKP